MTRQGTDSVVSPLRLEPKKEFKKRFRKSPDETDACALAALAVKERLGVMPFGSLPRATPTSLVSTAPVPPPPAKPDETWGAQSVDSADSYSFPS